MNLPIYFLAAAFAIVGIGAKHLTEPDYSYDHLACDMACKNNALCRYRAEQQNELQRLMQSGKMVQECLCVGHWVGMACDIRQDEGCDRSGSECDCTEADKLTVFAGEQCRRPFTEYCASLANSVGGHISFCTNGGKCKRDYLGAQNSPGNTTANHMFQHHGCICPPEFTGEHCELLDAEGYKLMKTNVQHTYVNEDASLSKKPSSVVMGVIVGVGLTVLLVLIANKFRRIRQQQRLNNRSLAQSDCILRRDGRDESDILEILPKIA